MFLKLWKCCGTAVTTDCVVDANGENVDSMRLLSRGGDPSASTSSAVDNKKEECGYEIMLYEDATSVMPCDSSAESSTVMVRKILSNDEETITTQEEKKAPRDEQQQQTTESPVVVEERDEKEYRDPESMEETSSETIESEPSLTDSSSMSATEKQEDNAAAQRETEKALEHPKPSPDTFEESLDFPILTSRSYPIDSFAEPEASLVHIVSDEESDWTDAASLMSAPVTENEHSPVSVKETLSLVGTPSSTTKRTQKRITRIPPPRSSPRTRRSTYNRTSGTLAARRVGDSKDQAGRKEKVDQEEKVVRKSGRTKPTAPKTSVKVVTPRSNTRLTTPRSNTRSTTPRSNTRTTISKSRSQSDVWETRNKGLSRIPASSLPSVATRSTFAYSQKRRQRRASIGPGYYQKQNKNKSAPKPAKQLPPPPSTQPQPWMVPEGDTANGSAYMTCAELEAYFSKQAPTGKERQSSDSRLIGDLQKWSSMLGECPTEVSDDDDDESLDFEEMFVVLDDIRRELDVRLAEAKKCPLPPSPVGTF